MSMLSEGAVSYEQLLTMPVSQIVLIYERLEYVLKKRSKIVRRLNGGSKR